jgi:hypothetical protein
VGRFSTDGTMYILEWMVFFQADRFLNFLGQGMKFCVKFVTFETDLKLKFSLCSILIPILFPQLFI